MRFRARKSCARAVPSRTVAGISLVGGKDARAFVRNRSCVKCEWGEGGTARHREPYRYVEDVAIMAAILFMMGTVNIAPVAAEILFTAQDELFCRTFTLGEARVEGVEVIFAWVACERSGLVLNRSLACTCCECGVTTDRTTQESIARHST